MFSSIFETTKQRWSNAQSWERGLAVGLMVCIVVAIAAWQLVPKMGSGRLVPLYTELGPSDAADIKAHLDERSIPYEVGPDNTINVKPEDVYELRLDLASEGIPSGGVVGFEIMDSIPMGATDFDRHVSYIRALQGELSRTIEGFDEVKKARVHIVLPQDSVFVSQSDPATAAIVLDLQPGATLHDEAIRGVMNLVASGVEGMESDNVTVVDTDGAVLSERVRTPDGLTGAAQGNLALQMELETGLRDRLSTLLQQVLGPGNVAVQVSANVNFDSREIHQEVFEPVEEDEGLVTSLQRVEEHFSGSSELPEDVAGADSNVPSYPSYGAGGDSEYERTETTEDSVVNRITEMHTVAPGTVERLSVAVVVNDVLTDEESQMLETVVASALGSDPERRDQVSITGIPFDTSLADQLDDDGEQTTATPGQEREIPTLYYAVAAGLFILIALVITILIRRRKREDFVLAEEDRGRRSPESSMPRGMSGIENRNALLEAIGHKGADLQDTKQMATEEPGKVAELLRTWLAEDGDGHHNV